MSYSRAAVSYRRQEILTASPKRLVVIIYDHLLANLRRARMAIETKNISARAEALSKANAAVIQLLVSTDLERGGKLAEQLRALYSFMFGELLQLGRKPDVERIDKIIKIVSQLHESFSTIANEPVSRVPAA
jgi:flagellar secretion chaperone FliS